MSFDTSIPIASLQPIAGGADRVAAIGRQCIIGDLPEICTDIEAVIRLRVLYDCL